MPLSTTLMRLLYEDGPVPPPRCPRCARPGYCPAHGTYSPPTDDLEVIEAVAADSVARRCATRVIRKPLEH